MYLKTDTPNYKPHNYKPFSDRDLVVPFISVGPSRPPNAFNGLSMRTTLPDESQGFVALNVIYTQINMMDYVIDCFQDPSASHPVPGRPIFFRFCNSNRGFNGFMCGWQPTVV